MSDELKSRLDELSEGATPGPYGVESYGSGTTYLTLGSWVGHYASDEVPMMGSGRAEIITSNIPRAWGEVGRKGHTAHFLAELANAYRSGKLHTRTPAAPQVSVPEQMPYDPDWQTNAPKLDTTPTALLDDDALTVAYLKGFADGKAAAQEDAALAALSAEVERLKAELATARDDALEAAAAAVGEIPCKIGDTKHYWKCQDVIRALKGPKP